jgi:hypothetical protein
MPHIPHPGVAGLVLNTLAGILLVFFPPGAEGIKPTGEKIVDSTFGFSVIGLRGRYLWLTWGFRIAMGLLVVGFILQGADLLTS